MDDRVKGKEELKGEGRVERERRWLEETRFSTPSIYQT